MPSDPPYLQNLTDEQRDAVLHEDGPMLVVAGPGSGKTRVITRRVTHLVARGINPASILAITFTNKAAQEMRRRVLELCPAEDAWIRTFHSACAAILRRWPRSAGLEPGFSIFDTSDQLRVVKDALKKNDIPTGRLRPRQALTAISHWKTEGIAPEEAHAHADGPIQDDQATVYGYYAAALDTYNAVDFDDLLVRCLAALQNDADLCRRLQFRFEHVLVDEYQDTSPVQFQLAKLLAARTQNICATGDPDQAIYAFRKADVRNILDFGEAYPGAKIVRLQWNFRSTGNVLAVADSLIAHNIVRHEKRLLTNAEDGPRVRVIVTSSETEEGQVIAEQVLDAYSRGVPYRDIAVFYRVNAQSRAIEMGLRSRGIPYVIVRGVEFYQRAEIKDLLAYLKVLANPRDRESMVRVLGTPTKGIGAKTILRIDELGRENGLNAREVLAFAAEKGGFNKRARLGLRATEDLLTAHEPLMQGKVADLMRRLVGFLRYEKYLEQKFPADAQDRIDNVHELIGSAELYDERSQGQGDLVGYLTDVGLVSDVDSYDPEAATVSLMTLHSAKGLEFREVLVAGVEEGILPHARSLAQDDVEEERRLFFVGITRAKHRLTLTYALSRRATIGSEERASSFIDELPQDLLDHTGTSYGGIYGAGLGGGLNRGFGGKGVPQRGRGGGGGRRGGRGGGWGAGRARDPSGFEADVQPDYDVPPDFDAAADYNAQFGATGMELLRPGMRVLHDHFGEGEVRQLVGRGAATRAVVRFADVGEKTLALEHARLTVLE